MAMPQRDDTIEAIKRLDALLEHAVMHGDEEESERLREKLRFGGEIRQRRTRRARKRPQASSRLIASIVSSLCGIAIALLSTFRYR